MTLIKYQPAADIVGYTTTKEQGNLSFTVGDKPELVLERRKKLADTIGIDLNRFVFARQQHTDKIAKVTEQDAGRGALSHEEGIPGVDGLYTFDENLVLAFFHADCVPILLHDPVSGLIGAIHSGWQGTLHEITRKALEKIQEDEGIDLANLNVYVGPCLSKESSSIDQDLSPYLVDSTFNNTDYIETTTHEFKIDTRGLTHKMLEDAGVKKENITTIEQDTYQMDESYFSFQRDTQTGRHLTLIYKKGQQPN